MEVHWGRERSGFWQSAQVRHNWKLGIQPKLSRKVLWTCLAVLHKLVTLTKGDWLVDHYYTTLGRTLYTPGNGSAWDNSSESWKWGCARHELSHMDYAYFGEPDLQAKVYLEHKTHYLKMPEKSWLFTITHYFKYLFWPVPFFFAKYRQRVEYWGYLQQIRQSVFEHEGVCRPETRAWVYRNFCGPNYGWMATKKRAEEIVDQMVHQAEQEYQDGTLSVIMFGPSYRVTTNPDAFSTVPQSGQR